MHFANNKQTVLFIWNICVGIRICDAMGTGKKNTARIEQIADKWDSVLSMNHLRLEK